MLAADCSPLTLRSYAFALLDWLRFLATAGLEETLHHIADKKTHVQRVQASQAGSTTPVWLTLSPTPS